MLLLWYSLIFITPAASMNFTSVVKAVSCSTARDFYFKSVMAQKKARLCTDFWKVAYTVSCMSSISLSFSPQKRAQIYFNAKIWSKVVGSDLVRASNLTYSGSKVILGAEHHTKWSDLWRWMLKEMESKWLLMKQTEGKYRTLKTEKTETGGRSWSSREAWRVV